MKPPFAPTMAIIFMIHIENSIPSCTKCIHKLYRRYVDEIFEHKGHINPFPDFMNQQHTNIKFIRENELNDKLQFLDGLVKQTNNRYYASQYFINTDTGLYNANEKNFAPIMQ